MVFSSYTFWHIIHRLAKYLLVNCFCYDFVATFIRMEIIACLWHAEEIWHGEIVTAHWGEEVYHILLW